MRIANHILLAVIVIALAMYAFDCLAMSTPDEMAYPSHLFSSQCCRGLMHRKTWIPNRRSLRRIATRRQFPKQPRLHLFAFNQPSSRLAASRAGVPRHITFCWKEE